ncbi:unnamed protein product [Heligmosomoides polygyrus]|uniref:Uncharacterized protein n=1 Tax=Heligmosomoides polygyrus TaxID=6339 RepID=A0A183GKL7_HELPZ|nr:unnamed protein product [Heligmosomoides polygyrus]
MRSVVGTPMMRTTEPKKDIQSESADRAPAREYGNVEDEEAPPPYECFVPPPDQARNDWNCVLENEVNGSRAPAPFT